MPVKTAIFLLVFAGATVATLLSPYIGVLAYMAVYSLGADRWWFVKEIGSLGIRYSFTLAAVTAVSILLHPGSWRSAPKLLLGQEKLILLFLALVWASVLMSGGGLQGEGGADHPAMKLTKIIIFLMMLTHVVSDMKRLDGVVWLLVGSAFILGVQAYTVPESAFAKGRLEAVGGPDFTESNALAAYMASLLPLIAVQFARSRWIGKLVCLGAGAFCANTIILTRSRGSMVGIGVAAIAALALAPKKLRRKVLVTVIVLGLGGLYLADPGFFRRAETIETPSRTKDEAAQGRFAIWRASWEMLKEHPLGVGAGNFKTSIGGYISMHEGRDAHSLFVRCYGELGVPGLILLAALIGGAVVSLRRVAGGTADLPEAERKRTQYLAYAMCVSLVALVACGLAVTLLYLEVFWWFLALPACLRRATETLRQEVEAQPLSLPKSPLPRRRKRVRVGARPTAGTSSGGAPAHGRTHGI